MDEINSLKTKKLLYLFTILVVFTSFGLFYLRGSTAHTSTEWMCVFRLEDINSIDSIVRFFRDLRIPVVFYQSVVEIFEYNVFKSNFFSTVILYKIYFLGAFILAAILCYPRLYAMTFCFIFGIIFIYGASIVHYDNAQIYDVSLPFYFLAFILLLQLSNKVHTKKTKTCCLILSGIMLSLLELTRPFIFYILPFLLFYSYAKCTKRYFFYLIIPVIAISGLLHLNYYFRHDQIILTNHTGYNMIRAWSMVQVPELVPEDTTPLNIGGCPNLNNFLHDTNSKRLVHAIIKYVYTHPSESLSFIFSRFNAVLEGKDYIFGNPFMLNSVGQYSETYTTTRIFLPIYKFFARLACMATVMYLFRLVYVLAFYLFSDIRLLLQIASGREALICIFCVFCILCYSLGESGEEARFLISLLPVMLVIPEELDVDLKKFQLN